MLGVCLPPDQQSETTPCQSTTDAHRRQMRFSSSSAGFHPQRPVTTSTEGLRDTRLKLDWTQKIEKKLAEYGTSQNICKRWIFEILSWLVSALCMGSIVGIYVFLRHQRMSQAGELLTYANLLSKVASAALIVPTSEALGQLKWSWFHQSKAMWDFEIFDKASRYEHANLGSPIHVLT
jgi:hypothetical protein